MDYDLLVRVFTPVVSRRNEEKPGINGTGYPITPVHVLTARHNVRPDSMNPPRERLTDSPISVLWPSCLGEESAKWFDLQLDEKAIVWEDEALDIALLDCTGAWPTSVAERYGILFSGPLETGHEWESRGFAEVGNREGVREPEPFCGKCFGKAAKEKHIRLSVETAPEDKKFWHGASGMPIFSLRQKKIIGIAIETVSGYQSRELKAVSVADLWDVEVLVKAWSRTEGQANRDKQKADMKALLDQAPLLRKNIANRGKLLKSRDNANDIIETLINEKDFTVALKELIHIKKQMSEDGAAERLSQLDSDLRHLMYLLAAYFVEPSHLAQVTLPLKLQHATFIDVPAAIEFRAAIILAAAEGKTPQFKDRPTEESWAQDKYRLEDAPFGGLTEDDKRARLEGFQKKFSSNAPDFQEMRMDLSALMNGWYRPAPGAPVPDGERGEKFRCASVARALRARRLREGGRRYYLCCQLAGLGEEERRQMTDFMNWVSSAYENEVVVLKLSEDPDQGAYDEEMFIMLNQEIAVSKTEPAKSRKSNDDGTDKHAISSTPRGRSEKRGKPGVSNTRR